MTETVDRMLPLYQGMMATFFDHRAADVVRSATATKRQNQPNYLSTKDHQDPYRLALAAYWVSAEAMPTDCPAWWVGFSDITSATNERTLVPVTLPPVAVGNKVPLMVTDLRGKHCAALVACTASLVVDFVARQKIGGTSLNYFYVKQFPVLDPSNYAHPTPWRPDIDLLEWVSRRARELIYTAWDMEPFAKDLGDHRPPFRWDTGRRALLRAELDAAYFHLYGVERDDVVYILDTFPIVRRKDEAAHGEYRTKRLILEICDAMATAIETGEPYQTVLDPPPGHGPRHPERT